MFIAGQVINAVLNLCMIILIARMILSWVPMFVSGWEPKGPILVVAELIYSITDPPLKFLRRYLRPVQVGTVAFDLAFLALMVGLSVAMWLNRAIFFGVY